jgi:prepilin-type N-terminal cleavage/methylation domain-containing protein
MINNKGFGILELLVVLAMIGILAPPVYKLMFQGFTMTQKLTTAVSNASVTLAQLNTAITQAQGAADYCKSSCPVPTQTPIAIIEGDGPCDH